MMFSFEGFTPLLAAGILDPEPGLMVWTIITFLVLLVVLWMFAWKPLLAALERRESLIRDSVESAQKLKDEAQKLMEQYQSQLQKAREDARAIVDEGRRDGEVLKKEITEKAHAEANERIEHAKREISLATDAALDTIHKRAVELSVDMASKVIKRSLSAKDHQELIRGALQEIEARH